MEEDKMFDYLNDRILKERLFKNYLSIFNLYISDSSY